jgi:hypothetical protein
MADALDYRRHAGTQGRMNAVLEIRSASATSRRHSEQKDCCWLIAAATFVLLIISGIFP